MALTSTIVQFQIDLSDMDRNYFDTLSVRMAQHPSETTDFLLCRLFAYCLNHDEGMFFSQGLCVPSEPAVGQKTHDGRLLQWIEVGVPSVERLKKALHSSERVKLYTYKTIAPLSHALRKEPRLRDWNIEVVEFKQNFLEELADRLERKNHWQIMRTESTLFVTTPDGNCAEYSLNPFPLSSSQLENSQ